MTVPNGAVVGGAKDEVGDQRRPARLVAGVDAPAGVTVEVLVEGPFSYVIGGPHRPVDKNASVRPWTDPGSSHAEFDVLLRRAINRGLQRPSSGSRAARVAVSVAVPRCTRGFTRDQPRTWVQVERIWTASPRAANAVRVRALPEFKSPSLRSSRPPAPYTREGLSRVLGPIVLTLDLAAPHVGRQR